MFFTINGMDNVIDSLLTWIKIELFDTGSNYYCQLEIQEWDIFIYNMK